MGLTELKFATAHSTAGVVGWSTSADETENCSWHTVNGIQLRADWDHAPTVVETDQLNIQLSVDFSEWTDADQIDPFSTLLDRLNQLSVSAGLTELPESLIDDLRNK